MHAEQRAHNLLIQKTQGYVIYGCSSSVLGWANIAGLEIESMEETTPEEWIAQGIRFFGNAVGSVTPKDVEGWDIMRVVFKFPELEAEGQLRLESITKEESLESSENSRIEGAVFPMRTPEF